MAAAPLKDVANISEWVPERVPMHLKYAAQKIGRSAPICEKHPSHHEEPIMVGGVSIPIIVVSADGLARSRAPSAATAYATCARHGPLDGGRSAKHRGAARRSRHDPLVRNSRADHLDRHGRHDHDARRAHRNCARHRDRSGHRDCERSHRDRNTDGRSGPLDRSDGDRRGMSARGGNDRPRACGRWQGRQSEQPPSWRAWKWIDPGTRHAHREPRTQSGAQRARKPPRRGHGSCPNACDARAWGRPP